MAMKSLCRTSLFALAMTLTASTAIAADPLTGFKSVNVDLPFGDRMFEGPGADVVNNNCLACHSVGMVMTQPLARHDKSPAEVLGRRLAGEIWFDGDDRTVTNANVNNSWLAPGDTCLAQHKIDGAAHWTPRWRSSNSGFCVSTAAGASCTIAPVSMT